MDAAATGEPGVVDLDALDRRGSDGVVWSLPQDGDLNANLVKLGAGAQIAPHDNDEVDVLLVVVAGSGVAVLDGAEHVLRPNRLLLLRKGTRRSLAAAPDAELIYLTVHRARAGLRIGSAARRSRGA
jgi:quercetin dioxygenase-like cupin family protein